MSDNEEEAVESVYKPSFVLIAIDTNPSMFVKKEGSESTPFKECINACYQLADSLIFNQNKRSWSPFGIVLAREDASASFVDFSNKVLDTIKFLKEKSGLSSDKLSDEYQRKGSLDLSAFFLFCKKKFKEIQSAFYKRTIIYITNDDDPVRGDKSQRFAAINEAKNFEANNIEFQIVTMNHNFDYKNFYNELFSVMKLPLVEVIIEDEEGLLEKLSSLIVLRYYQRRLNFFPFKGDDSRFIKVIQKKIIMDQKLYNNAHVDSEGKPVKKKTTNPPDIQKNYVLKYAKGNDQVKFDVQENFDLKNNDLPHGYSLIYVSNRITDVGMVLSDSMLLEVDYKEDLPYFNSFWQYCVDKNKVLVCVRKLKKLDKIRFVEFIPKFANNTKLFLVKTIPFINEIKYPPTKLEIDDNTNSVSDTAIRVTNQLINTLTFDYHPKMFTNPSFAKKRAYLRSKFLDESIEDVEDVTLDNEAIDSRLGDIAYQFKNLFNLGEEPAKKRKGGASTTTSKRRK